MAEPFLGQIKMVGFNFAPRGYARCDGQLLAIAQNTALFSVLGTIYGGDGRTTFGLPDLRGRVPINTGNGPGLTPRREGQRGGQENVGLTSLEMPSHTHMVSDLSQEVTDESGDKMTGADNILAAGEMVYSSGDGDSTEPLGGVGPPIIGNTGSSQSHNNMAPTLTIQFIIALQGVFPSRN